MSEPPGPESAGPRTDDRPRGDEPRPEDTAPWRGPQQPRTLPPTPPDRGGRRAMWLALAGVAVFLVPITNGTVIRLVLLAIAIVLSSAAIIVGIRSRRSARRVLAPSPGALAGIVIGSIALAMSAVTFVVLAVIIGQMGDYMKCRNAANTNTDVRACQDQYFPKIEHRLRLPAGSLNHYRSLL